MNLEQQSKSSESKTESRKLSGGSGGGSAVELAKDLERGDEADKVKAYDEHDGRWDLQAGSVIDVGGLTFLATLLKRYNSL